MSQKGRCYHINIKTKKKCYHGRIEDSSYCKKHTFLKCIYFKKGFACGKKLFKNAFCEDHYRYMLNIITSTKPSKYNLKEYQYSEYKDKLTKEDLEKYAENMQKNWEICRIMPDKGHINRQRHIIVWLDELNSNIV